MKKVLSLTVLATVMVFFLLPEAGALPTFARKYRTSCNTCHVAIPKLTAFGESFRLNGYQIPEGDEAYVKEEPVSLGAPAWKRVWPNAVWPGEIPGAGPLSARVVSDFNVNPASSTASTEFDFPHEVELFWAGTLGKNIPFFLEVGFEGGATATDAWLGFFDLFSGRLPERALNLKVGNLMMDDVPIAGVGADHLRMGKSHYLIGDWRMSGSANQFRLRDARPGVELNGILASRFWYGLAVVQGDETKDKDLWTALRYKFGGTPYDSSTGGTEGAIGGKASGFWVDDALEVSALGYFGETGVGDNEADDKFNRLGLGGRWSYQNLALSAAYIWGENDDPYGASSAQSVDSEAWHIEADYVFFPWMLGELRYESLNVDEPTDFAVTDMNQSRWVPGLIFQVRPNIKLVCEGLFYDSYGASDASQDAFFARLDVAF